MLNNVKKLLLMSDAFEIHCDHNDAAAVQKAFQPLRLGGNEVKLKLDVVNAVVAITDLSPEKVAVYGAKN